MFGLDSIENMNNFNIENEEEEDLSPVFKQN